jgi:hypothetical protein
MLLNALDTNETVAVQAHLRGCANCRSEAETLRPVANLLGWAAPDAGAPSAKVKQRLMNQISTRPEPAPAPRRWFRQPLAVFATAAIVLGGWAYATQAQSEQQQARLDRLTQQQAALRQFMLDGNMRQVPVRFEGQSNATAVIYEAADRVAVAVDGLPPLTGDEVYQCWWEAAQTAVAGTAFKVDNQGSGMWVWKWPGGGSFDKMIITRESHAGVDKSYGPLILTANLK